MGSSLLFKNSTIQKGRIMPRCKETRSLQVHHKKRNGGNGLENAEVLCLKCHSATSSYGVQGISPPEFSESTKQAAMIRSGFRCECTRVGGCH